MHVCLSTPLGGSLGAQGPAARPGGTQAEARLAGRKAERLRSLAAGLIRPLESRWRSRRRQWVALAPAGVALGLLAACGRFLLSDVRAAVEIGASTSYVLPGVAGRVTEIYRPVALDDGGTAFIAKLEDAVGQVLVVRRPTGVLVVRPADLGLAAAGVPLFLGVTNHGAEVLFVAYTSLTPSGVGIFRADPGGPLLLVPDPIGVARQFRNGWGVGEWTARDGAFALLSSYSMGRVGFGTISTTLSHYRAGVMTPIAVTRTGTPAFTRFSDVALAPGGERIYFRGELGYTSVPGKPTTYEAGIYAWEKDTLRTILDPQTRFVGESVSVDQCVIGDDEAVAFHDSRRNAIALFSGSQITELVANGTRAADGTLVELSNPRVLRLDRQYVYFTASRRFLAPWGTEGVRDDLILRVPRGGGAVEVFFHPARLLADATRVAITNLAVTGDVPLLTFQVREIWGTQQAYYRATPPFGPVEFPAVPPGYPSVVLKAGWPDGFYHRAGERATLEAQVEGPGPVTFAWFVDGRRVTATDTPYVRTLDGTLMLFPFAQTYHSGDYKVAVTNAAGTSVVTASVLVGADTGYDGGSPPPLVNYSVRGYSTTAEGVFTAGFSLLPPIEQSYNANGRVLTPVAGTSQRLLLRAVGPGLAPFAREDVVPAPATRLELFQGNQVIARNEGNWAGDSTVASTAAAVGAFPLVPGSRDSALLTTLTPGVYTAQTSAPLGDGTVLVECYIVQGRGPVRNLSARGFVTDVEPRSLTLGFVIQGSGARPVLVRAAGPGLRAFGVNNAASRPRLEIFGSGGERLAENASHSLAPNRERIEGAARQFGAFPLASDSADAAILLHLPQGVYIARVTASAGSPGGIALIELYTNQGYDSPTTAVSASP